VSGDLGGYLKWLLFEFHKQGPASALFEVSFASSTYQETRPVLDLLFHGCGFWKLVALKGGTAQGNVALAVAAESPFSGRSRGHGLVTFLV
jgi:hypothetical protein